MRETGQLTEGPMACRAGPYTLRALMPPETPTETSSPETRTFELSAERSGDRLDVFLTGALVLSRAQVRRLLERGAVSLDGRRLTRRDKGMLLPGEGAVKVEPFRRPADQRPAPEPGSGAPPILASGEGWLAVDKPAGMPTHPLQEDETGSALGQLLPGRPEMHGVGEGGLRSGVVHRLDVETSGVLLFASEEATWQRLRGAFRQHRVEKRYRAVVQGEFAPPGGVLEQRLCLTVARHRPAQVRVVPDAEAGAANVRVILQSVVPLEILRGASLVEVRPSTGFLHQIRASLAHIGHPVLGDAVYGNEASAETSLGCGAGRHLLHAAFAGYEEIEAHSPDPADFTACIEVLRSARA